MGHFDKTTEKKLYALLEKAFDAEKRFANASEYSSNPRLKSLLLEKARERDDQIYELKNTLKIQGIDIYKNNDHVFGLTYPTWIDTKALISADSEASMLTEVKNCEKAAIEDYNDILENYELDPVTRDVIMKQKNEIQMSYNKADYLQGSY